MLFDNDKALEIAESIAKRGYFPNEPLLAIHENGGTVVVEGNRRLAALKALHSPELLDGSAQIAVKKLAKSIRGPATTAAPVVLARDRRSTDPQLAGRHVGSPVLPWAAENRANFILAKLEEGYTEDEVSDELGFNLSDIAHARQTKAIADITRSLPLSQEVRKKLASPRSGVLSTIQRVFDSKIGRDRLRVEPDEKVGFRGKTSPERFVKAMTKLVTDVAEERETSRTLNKSEDINRYFNGWTSDELPAKKGTFVPSDITAPESDNDKTDASKAKPTSSASPRSSTTVVPKAFKVLHGGDRLKEIRNELCRIDREDFPNAGAVLLRVFFELAATDYLERTNKYEPLKKRLAGKGRLPYDALTMKQIVPELISIAKSELPHNEAKLVEKAITYDHAAPFSLSDMHSFVHHNKSFPSERDLFQFWHRIEPLMRLFLERPANGGAK
jgi:hypothetical protein